MFWTTTELTINNYHSYLTLSQCSSSTKSLVGSLSMLMLVRSTKWVSEIWTGFVLWLEQYEVFFKFQPPTLSEPFCGWFLSNCIYRKGASWSRITLPLKLIAKTMASTIIIWSVVTTNAIFRSHFARKLSIFLHESKIQIYTYALTFIIYIFAYLMQVWKYNFLEVAKTMNLLRIQRVL